MKEVPKKHSYIGCDLFSGAGGMSSGAELAGISIRIAVENDKYAAQTYQRNHKNTELIEEDIRYLNPKEYFNESPFVVFGGPPCQGFSLSNTVTRNIENKNNSLFEEYLRFVEELEPEWCVFENVEGFRSFHKGKVVQILKERLQDLGYTVAYDVLSASDFGVPQDRRRFFMIGNKSGVKFEFPKVTKDKVTVSDAISDLPVLGNGDNYEVLPYRNGANSSFAASMRGRSKRSKQNYVTKNKDYVIERYHFIKPGQNWTAIPEHLMTNYKNKEKCHSGIYKRLDPAKPAVVISNYRKNMLIHPKQHRGLSVREAARLQSFPDNFVFQGPLMYIQQQIGNAVPPLLAKAIFTKLVRMQ